MCFLQWLLVLYGFNICRAQLCTNSTLSAFNFASLAVKYTSCSDSSSGSVITQSRLDCSRKSLSTRNCVVFSYNKTTGLCSFCSGESIQSIVFDAGLSKEWYWYRQGIQYVEDSSTTYINKRLDLPCGITAGNLVKYKITYTQCKHYYRRSI